MSFTQSDVAGILKELITPERFDVFARASDLLTENGTEQHEDAFAQVIARYDNEAPETTVYLLEHCLSTVLEDALADHGIYFRESSIAIFSNALRTVLDLPDYGDPDALLRIIEDSVDPESTFAELYSVLTMRPALDILDTIERVDSELFDVARELLNNAAESIETQRATDEMEDGDALDVNHYRARLEEFLSKTEFEDTPIVKQVISAGSPLGTNFDLLVEMSYDSLKDLMPESLAKELLGLAYASNLKLEEIPEQVRTEAEAIAGNMDAVTQTSVALEHLLGDS